MRVKGQSFYCLLFAMMLFMCVVKLSRADNSFMHGCLTLTDYKAVALPTRDSFQDCSWLPEIRLKFKKSEHSGIGFSFHQMEGQKAGSVVTYTFGDCVARVKVKPNFLLEVKFRNAYEVQWTDVYELNYDQTYNGFWLLNDVRGGKITQAKNGYMDPSVKCKAFTDGSESINCEVGWCTITLKQEVEGTPGIKLESSKMGDWQIIDLTTTTTITTPSTTKRNSPIAITTKASRSTSPTNMMSTIDEEMPTHLEDINGETTNAEDDSLLLVYILAPLAVLLVVIFAVVGFVVYRRRRKVKKDGGYEVLPDKPESFDIEGKKLTTDKSQTSNISELKTKSQILPA